MAGSMREKRPGVWELRARAGRDPATGTYRQVSKTFRGGKRDAARALTALCSEVDGGRHLAAATTVADLLDRYLEHLAYRGRSPSTIQGYRWRAAKVIGPAFGARPVDKLTAADLDRLYAAEQARGLEATTIRQTHALLRGALGQAVKWGLVARNVGELASPPSLRDANIPSPDPTVVRAALAAADAGDRMLGDAWGVCLQVVAVTGCRRGEVVGLRWSDLAGSVLPFTSSVLQVGGDQLLVKDLKEHGRRPVWVDDVTVARLTAHRAAMVTLAAAGGHPAPADGYVFTREPGWRVPWKPDQVSDAWERTRALIGAPTVRLHDCADLRVMPTWGGLACC